MEGEAELRRSPRTSITRIGRTIANSTNAWPSSRWSLERVVCVGSCSCRMRFGQGLRRLGGGPDRLRRSLTRPDRGADLRDRALDGGAEARPRDGEQHGRRRSQRGRARTRRTSGRSRSCCRRQCGRPSDETIDMRCSPPWYARATIALAFAGAVVERPRVGRIARVGGPRVVRTTRSVDAIRLRARRYRHWPRWSSENRSRRPEGRSSASAARSPTASSAVGADCSGARDCERPRDADRPTWSVHTAFMRFAIDVVFLDGDLTVLEIRKQLRPWRAAVQRRRALGARARRGRVRAAGDRGRRPARLGRPRARRDRRPRLDARASARLAVRRRARRGRARPLRLRPRPG